MVPLGDSSFFFSMTESYAYARGMRTIYTVYFERMAAFRLRHDSLNWFCICFLLDTTRTEKGFTFWVLLEFNGQTDRRTYSLTLVIFPGLPVSSRLTTTVLYILYTRPSAACALVIEALVRTRCP